MIIHDMRITLPDQPELTNRQNTRLNEAILKQRDRAEASARANPKFIDIRWLWNGYIHLPISERFFLYKLDLIIEKVAPYGIQSTKRRIISESTTEVTMNEWLDAYLENPPNE